MASSNDPDNGSFSSQHHHRPFDRYPQATRQVSPTTLVTGATGFVGSHLLQRLASSSGPPLVGWRRRPRPERPGVPTRTFPPATQVQWQQVDVLDYDAVVTALAQSQPTQIYHLAGVAGVHESWGRVVPTLEGNVRGTDNILRAVKALDMKTRVLIPGSALVYRSSSGAIAEDDPLGPVSPYGLSKLAQEMLARQCVEAGADIVLTRSFTHIGPGQDASYAASGFARQIAQIEAGHADPIIRVGFLGARRDLLDVRDTVDAYAALMARGTTGRTYNVCSGRAHLISEILDGLVSQARVSVHIEPDAQRMRAGDNLFLLGDPRRLREDIEWRPSIALEQTLCDLLESWRAAM